MKNNTVSVMSLSSVTPLEFDSNVNEIRDRNLEATYGVKYKNKNQEIYSKAIANKKPITIGIGPAGCGKTYMAVKTLVDLLQNKTIKSIFVIRPPVEAGTKIGALPGDIEEKMAGFNEVVMDTLIDILGKEATEKMINENVVRFLFVGFLRGKSLKDAGVLVDETQNFTFPQLKLIITRITDSTKFVFSGDDRDQTDIKDSGIHEFTRKLKGASDITDIIEFTNEDSQARCKYLPAILNALEK